MRKLSLMTDQMKVVGVLGGGGGDQKREGEKKNFLAANSLITNAR